MAPFKFSVRLMVSHGQEPADWEVALLEERATIMGEGLKDGNHLVGKVETEADGAAVFDVEYAG